MKTEVQKKNGISFSMVITLRDVIWTVIFLISLYVGYEKIVFGLDNHVKDSNRHLEKTDREQMIVRQEKIKMIDERLDKIDDKLDQLLLKK